MRYHLTPARMAIIKKSIIINTGERVEKREPYYTDGGNVNWYNYNGNSMEMPQNTKNRITI